VAALGVGFVVVQRGMVSSTSPAEETPAPTAEPTLEEPPTALITGTLRVETRPTGAQVRINGEPKGSAPVELTGLGPGQYEVGVELAGYRPRTESVALTADAPRQELTLELTRRPPATTAPAAGRADIDSTPPGAQVSIDGRNVGETPLKGIRVSVGTHRVEISKAGHGTFRGSVNVSPDRTTSLSASLQPLVAKEETPTPTPAVDVTRIYGEREVDAPPKRTSGQSPSYRPKLKPGERISVTVSWVVDENGEVTDVTVTESGGEELDEAVTEAIRKWRYEPGAEAGVKVKVRLVRKYTYRAG
jgi:TonB family protein